MTAVARAGVFGFAVAWLLAQLAGARPETALLRAAVAALLGALAALFFAALNSSAPPVDEGMDSRHEGSS